MSVKNSITTPIGIDVPIKRLQTRFSDDLFSGKTYYSYPRCYEIDGEQHVFTSGIDYEKLTQNDSIHALSFFVVNSEDEIEIETFEADVSIYFFVNLAQLCSSITNRADANVRREVMQIMDLKPYGFEVDNIEWGADVEDDIVNDMQPYYCFRINTKLVYEYTKTGC